MPTYKVEIPQRYAAEDEKMTSLPHREAEHAAAMAHPSIDFDPKDYHHSLGDRLDTTRDHPNLNEENRKTVHDPLQRAEKHFRKPSRGAQIDAEIMKEEQEMLRKGGK